MQEAGKGQPDPSDIIKIPTEFKPSVSIPWIISVPAPILYGLLVNKIAGTIDRNTSDTEVRVRNAISSIVLGTSTYFSARAALDEGVYTGIRIAAGITGIIWGISGVLAFFSAIAKGPMIKTKTELDRIIEYIKKRKSSS